METKKMTTSLRSTLNVLLAGSAISFGLIYGAPANARNCALDANGAIIDEYDENGELLDECEHLNSNRSVVMPAPQNLEFESLPDLNSDGFEISVDGSPVTDGGQILTDRTVSSAKQRLQDLALEEGNIAIQFDGGAITPRLDARVDRLDLETGAVTIRTELNYPAFVTRGEIRVIDTSYRGAGRVVQMVEVSPNQSVKFVLNTPSENYAFVYRVYDVRGRYDETQIAALGEITRQTGNATPIELGTDATAIRRIPIDGGAVTVSGHDIPEGTVVSALGTSTIASSEGKFVIQRILPVGDYAVDVDVNGRPILSRDLKVKSHDLFFVGIIDATIGTSIQNELADATGEEYDETYTRGRVAFYLKGKIKGEYLITASLDTGEEDLDEVLEKFDDKTAEGLLGRIDPDQYYPVYGDDSTSVEDAPTSGKLYVKIEKGNNFALWGDYRSTINETEYLRNQRTLYGAQIHTESQRTTSEGDARTAVQLYAASPDTLPASDRFVGTGGSTYFLKNNDITPGSETLEVETINPVSGQVISRRTLVFGTDYDVNYVQGLIILRSPLSGSADTNELINSSVSGDNEVQLVATYEYTPGSTEIEGMSFGGRAQAWINDTIRFGITGHQEEKGTSDLTVAGVDLRIKAGDNSYLDFEYAESEGDGFVQSTSADGGLTFDTRAASTGSGAAYRVAGQFDLTDFGSEMDGRIDVYYEDQSAGFASLTTQTDVDLTRWGISGDLALTEGTNLRFAYDDYLDGTGKTANEGSVDIGFALSEHSSLELGLEHLDQVTPGDATETGSRTDLGARLTYAPKEDRTYYVFGQYTADLDGGLDRNDRFGLGADLQINERWTAEAEISDGTTGFGARLLANYDRDENSSYYFGYTLDPGRSVGSTNTGSDQGAYVVGTRTRLNDDWSVFAENTYDLMGQHRSLTGVYGATYDHSEFVTYTAGIEIGSVTDPSDNTDFERTALSFGVQYRDEDLSAKGRLEYRHDQGETSGDNNDGEMIAASLALRYHLTDEKRLLLNAEFVDSQNASGTIPDATYGEFLLGYAYRPIDNDRLNLLAKYRYVYDVTERTDTTVGSDANFENTPKQKTHILSLDASYDLSNYWTLGGKFGGRWAEQDDGSGFYSNNAWLGVANLRYHVVHNWDALIEIRHLDAEASGSDSGFLAAVYRHVGNNAKVGLGYNFTSFSDDLADLTYNDQGIFLNIVAKF